MGTTEALELNWWCDHCQRGKTGYPSLPEELGVTDLGGELICDECNEPTITAVAQYDFPDELVWVYYRQEEPPAVETIHGSEVQKQHEHIFEEPVDVPTATETIEDLSDKETVTLVAPFKE